MRRKCIVLLLTAAAIAGCEINSLAPEEAPLSQALAHGLVTRLVVDRTEVAPGGSFTATYSITNTGSGPVQLESTCVAIARGVVYRNGTETPFIGSGSGCYTAIGSHVIAAGETLERHWQLEAAILLRAHPDGSREVAPAQPGDYIFRVIPDVFRIDGAEARLPALERPVSVR
jgi:hypothetical protein